MAEKIHPDDQPDRLRALETALQTGYLDYEARIEANP